MADGCSLLILAGGHSRRMGRDKATLPTRASNPSRELTRRPTPTFVEHIASRLRPVVDEVIIAGHASQGFSDNLRLVTDLFPGGGPLAGMHAGFLVASHEHVWVVACDLPDVVPQLGPLMLRLATEVDAVVPTINSQPQGVCAIYRRALATHLGTMLERGERSVKALLAGISVRWVAEPELRLIDPDLRSLQNINTPSEYEEWLRRR